MEYGWSGSGQYLTAPIVALSTELNGLATSSGDVLALSAPFSNSLGAVMADVEFVAGGAYSPVTDGFIEVWVIRSLDGGQTFWDGSATAAPARGADITIAVPGGSSITPHSGEPGLVLPPGTFKIAVRNQTGAALPAGSKIRLAEYGEASTDDGLTGMGGDVSGTQAFRIADMMERFGVVTYSQASLSVNTWGAGISDYTTSSVIQALTYLTANSGMHCNIREYHVASAASEQLLWAPAVNVATGAQFDISLLRGATTADVASLIQVANSSAQSTGWLTWAEGLNTPNDGSVAAATAVSIQQSLYSGCVGTRSMAHPVTPVGPSFSYTTNPPNQDSSVTGYLSSSQKASLLVASSLASARFFPKLNPDADDSSARGGNTDDLVLSQMVYYGKPTLIGEWHPTSGNTDSPSHATDDGYGAYYAVIAMLTFHRLGVEAWFWKSLFDIGQSGDSPFVRVGLFPNRGSDTPRLPARAIRAMYALTTDTGSSRRSFTPSKLDVTVSGLPAPGTNATPWTGGHWRLFQNSGGTFFLFVWNETLAPGGSASTVTITFAKAMAQVVHYDLTTDATTAETPITTPTNVSSLSFSLAGSVHLFVILPQGSTAQTESLQNTTLTSASGVIYDAQGTAWSLVNNPPFGNQVRHGSSIDSQNVVLLLYWDHTVWQQNSTGNWQFWNGTAWVAASSDPRTGQNESASGTVITGPGTTIFASQTPGQPATATLDLWTINAAAQAVRNGTADGTTSSVLELYYGNHVLYREESNGNTYGTPGWWSWGGSSWTVCPSPVGQTESAEASLVVSGLSTPIQIQVGVQAIPANTFLNSTGVNTHISQGFGGTPSYYISELQYIGLRNIREGAQNLSAIQAVCSATGVKAMINCHGTAIPTTVTFLKTLANAGQLVAIEGPNELNNFPITYNGQTGGGSGSWLPAAQYQRDLYAAKAADSVLQAYPMFAAGEPGAQTTNSGLQWLTTPSPSGNAGQPDWIGDNVKLADYAEVHNYVIGNPDNTGTHHYIDNQAWLAADGSGAGGANWGFDSIQGNFTGTTWLNHYPAASTSLNNTIPRVTTETGWDGNITIPETTNSLQLQGKMLVKTLLAQFKRGWAYTFLYEMIDSEGSADHQGMFTANPNRVAKPAADYVHNLTTILADTADFSTGKLNYSIPSQPSTVHELLLQKFSGAFELVIWGESVSGSDPITVNFGQTFPTVNVYDTTVGTSPVSTFSNASSVNLTMTDHALIVELF